MKKILIKVVSIFFLSIAPLTFSATRVQIAQRALFEAIRNGDLDAAKKALVSGADINGRLVGVPYGPGRTYEVNTPLIEAVEKGNLAMVKFLLEEKALVNEGNKYTETALIKAANKGYLEIVTLLLQHGANPNAVMKHLGTTPLIMAASTGHALIASLLLENGADMYRKEFRGRTALDIAKKKGNLAVAKVIEDFMAKKREERREETSEAILKTRPEVYPAITEEIAEFEIGK
ncbi:MAG: ankyrin repeat domain-containing protein [Candidatus Babeliales bacterium]